MRCLLAFLLAVTPALAQDDEIVEIVFSNAEHTLWHESAHMLIAELNLAVLGQEEDAADSFATLMMLAEEDPAARIERLLDVAELWIVSHERDEAEGIEPAYYDGHDLDAQRGLRVICFLAGEGPGRAHELIGDWGLPADRAETCEEDYNLALDGWERLLEPFLRPDTTHGNGNIIQTRYEAGPWRDLLREIELLELVAESLSYEYNLPRGLTMVAESCGEANAFWDPEARRVTLCYELLDDFEELARRAVATR